MRTNKNAHLTRKQKEIVEANFGLETIMVWVKKKAEEARDVYDSFEDRPRIQKEVLRDFIDCELSRIKWSKHHSEKVRTYVKFDAIARITEAKYGYEEKGLKKYLMET